MKTLIFNGSPRRGGDTDALVDELIRNVKGDVLMLTDEQGIRPCDDCRACRAIEGCAIDDGMQRIYRYLPDCDNVVIASPIWFSSLSGPLLNMASRLQTLFSARRFRDEPIEMKPKRGALILVGAEPGTEMWPERNAMTIMKLMNVRRPCEAVIRSMDTDHLPAHLDAPAMAAAREAALLLNSLYVSAK